MKNNHMHTPLSHIVLIGPAGAGKSTIGRAIATALNKPFYDTDQMIAKRTGVELAWIFDQEGEIGFRKRETAMLKELIALSPAVIATGNGTILCKTNCELLKTNHHIIHLHVALHQQFERSRRNQQTRPMLRGDNLKHKLLSMAKNRNPIYEQLAHVTFKTNDQSAKKVTQKIINYLQTVGY